MKLVLVLIFIFYIFNYSIDGCSTKATCSNPATPPPIRRERVGTKSPKIKVTPTPFKAKPAYYKRLRSTTPSPPKGKGISRDAVLAKFSKSGFYIEIEESLDNTLRIYQMKKLPPLYSQTMGRSPRKADREDWQNSYVQEISEDGTPIMSTENENRGDGLMDDAAVHRDWGGDCYGRNWNYCNSLKNITVMNVYNKIEGKSHIPRHMELDCKIESITCLKNGWTVNRCQLICMSKCNQRILGTYDKIVDHYGPCKM